MKKFHVVVLIKFAPTCSDAKGWLESSVDFTGTEDECRQYIREQVCETAQSYVEDMGEDEVTILIDEPVSRVTAVDGEFYKDFILAEDETCE